MKHSFPDSFETIEVATFFYLIMLLAEILEKADSGNKPKKVRALFWEARMAFLHCISAFTQHYTNSNSITVDWQIPLTGLPRKWRSVDLRAWDCDSMHRLAVVTRAWSLKQEAYLPYRFSMFCKSYVSQTGHVQQNEDR